jgi:hypothetical protein
VLKEAHGTWFTLNECLSFFRRKTELINTGKLNVLQVFKIFVCGTPELSCLGARVRFLFFTFDLKDKSLNMFD